jgi:DNA-binding MarR family transcriptional regulator/GNAT superfamily N-acetyltransferase
MSSIARVRSFNRTLTRQIGALDAHFLKSPRSLAACRLLFEIGSGGQEIVHLRASLGLDSGYLSRLLRGLEGERLVTTRGTSRDARVRRVFLTAAGRRELATLNRRSDRAAHSLLERLPRAQRETLVEAMGTVERLLVAAAVEIRIEAPTAPAARYCLTSYFAELAVRFETGFDPRQSIPASAQDFRPPRGYFLVARLYDDPIGCAGMKCSDACGEIKRMWVAPHARGLGVGTRLLHRLEELARRRALPRLRLETNKALKEAQALYRTNGFAEVPAFNAEPYAHFWFEKLLDGD